MSNYASHELGLFSFFVAGFTFTYLKPHGIKKVQHFKFELSEFALVILFVLLAVNLKLENFIYNLSDINQTQMPDVRIFLIEINGQKVVHELNLARDFGRDRAVELSFECMTDKGIKIKFDKIAGKTILSGIKLEKI